MHQALKPSAEMNIATKDTDRRPPKAQLTQICASQNDLFGLDSDGVVYQYDFKAKVWERLDERRAFSAAPGDNREGDL